MAGGAAHAHPWLAALGAVAGLLCAGPAHAQEFRCAALRPSSSQQPAYAAVPGAARCEGYFEQSVSQPFLELVSLTRGMARLQQGGALSLRAAGRSGARLTVQPLAASPLYRVDAWLAPDRPLRWDATAMLVATGLRPAELGFLAALPQPTDGGVMNVVPVALAAGHEASSAGFAMLRASVALSALAWRAYPPGGAGAGSWRTHRAPAYAWQPVALPFDLPADGQALRIDLRAQDAHGQPLPMLSFVIPGAAP